MRSFLASPRRRRRLAWAGTVLLVAAAIVGVGIVFTGGSEEIAPPGANRPFMLPEQEQAEQPLGQADAGSVLQVAGRFLLTAVSRKHIAESWELASPTLRAGYTRESWSRGEIPIIPYPVASARWDIDYTYRDRVGLRVAVFPTKKSKVAPAVFLIDLERIGKGRDRRWVVDGWQPLPGRAAASALPGVAGVPNLAPVDEGRGARQLSAAWILLPIGVLCLFVVALVSIGAVNWYRGKKADEAYVRSHVGGPVDYKSSSNPS